MNHDAKEDTRFPLEIIENLTWLCEYQANVILRLPMIPEFNMDVEDLRELRTLITELGIREVNLMPFHQLGKDKYSHLGKSYQLARQSDLRLDKSAMNQLLQVRDMLQTEKIAVTIGG